MEDELLRGRFSTSIATEEEPQLEREITRSRNHSRAISEPTLLRMQLWQMPVDQTGLDALNSSSPVKPKNMSLRPIGLSNDTINTLI